MPLAPREAIEAAFCCVALREEFLPANINFAQSEFPLDIVANKIRRVKARRVISNSFGFGGANATVLLERRSMMTANIRRHGLGHSAADAISESVWKAICENKRPDTSWLENPISKGLYRFCVCRKISCAIRRLSPIAPFQHHLALCSRRRD